MKLEIKMLSNANTHPPSGTSLHLSYLFHFIFDILSPSHHMLFNYLNFKKNLST